MGTPMAKNQNDKCPMTNDKFDKLRTWVAKNKIEATFLIVILLLGAFFRLWKIDQYLPFLGDEGRDVRVVYRFLTQFDLMFIGPRTSIGDMYLGPLYYYFISPWLLLFRFSPVGPAVSVAILGTATVAFIWYVAREWFGRIGAVAAALLYAVSPAVVGLSKHSWNPNIMPFFALLSIWSIWKVWKGKQYWWLVVLGISYAFVLQSHYLGLLLAPAILILGTLSWWGARQTANTRLRTQDGKRFLLYTLFGLAFFVLLMSPLVIFDSKHGWHNLSSMFIFFSHRQETVSAKPWSALPLLWPLWKQIVTSLLSGGNKVIGTIGGIGAIGGIFFYWWQKRKLDRPMFILILWLGVGLVGLGSLKQNVYDHYFGFLFPAPFLLIGGLAERVWNQRRWGRQLVLAGIVGLTLFNLTNTPLKHSGQNQLKRTENIDRKILQESGGKPFNIGLIAERNYNEGYLYFFDLWRSPAKEADPQRVTETVTDQLFVICEKQDCSPTTDASSQIAHFGMSKIVDSWEVQGVKIYKLAHSNP